MQPTTSPAPPALNPDPVIHWLERIRDFVAATPEAQFCAQEAIDRLTRANDPSVIDVIDQLLKDMGAWRRSHRGAVVADRPGGTQCPNQGPEDLRYYGGYLVGETIGTKAGIAIARLPELLEVAKDTPEGRAVLAEIAAELTSTPARLAPVVDRLDGALRLHRLADEFTAAKYEGVAELLKAIAVSVVQRTTPELAQRLYTWMETQKR